MKGTFQYVKMCPRCRVPVLWMAEFDEKDLAKFGKPVVWETGEKCKRCRRAKMVDMPIPVGCLHVWEVRGEPIGWG